MNSMERAPEPTMEEILASIRRIISDDEANPPRQPAPSAGRQQRTQASPDVMEDEADTQIIDDIARVLSGNSSQREADEEILDLTKALDEEQASPLAAPEPSQTAAPADFAEISSPEVQPPMEAAGASEPPLDLGADEAVEPESASDEAASALEQAIAALRAGELPTLAPDFERPTPDVALDSVTQAETEKVPEIESMAEPEAAAEEEGEPELLLAETIIMTDASDIGEFSGEAPAISSNSKESAPEAVSSTTETGSTFWPRSWSTEPNSPERPAHAMPEPEPERPPYTNGAWAHAQDSDAALSANKSMEESVKEMLRPLLRQWLDENMSRVLEAALREELRETRARRDQGDWPT